MPMEVVIAVIENVPRFLWVVLVVTLVSLFYRPVRYQILPRMTNLNVMGIEANFVRERMDRAIAARSVKVSGKDRERAVRRLRRVEDVFRSARILWIGRGHAGAAPEWDMLRCTGAIIDPAQGGREALKRLADARYDAIIYAEGAGAALRSRLIAAITARAIQPPLILYGGDRRLPRRRRRGEPGAPAGVFAVADRPDELLHCVADALERGRL